MIGLFKKHGTKFYVLSRIEQGKDVEVEKEMVFKSRFRFIAILIQHIYALRLEPVFLYTMFYCEECVRLHFHEGLRFNYKSEVFDTPITIDND